MPRAHVELRIPASAAELFRFLADARNLALWSSAATAMGPEHVPAGPQAYFRWRFPGRRRDHRLTCRCYRPDQELVFVGDRICTPLGWQKMTVAFSLAELADGVLLGITVVSRLVGPLGLLGPLVQVAWNRDLPVDAQRLLGVVAGRVHRMRAGKIPATSDGVRSIPAGHICRFSDGAEVIWVPRS